MASVDNFGGHSKSHGMIAVRAIGKALRPARIITTAPIVSRSTVAARRGAWRRSLAALTDRYQFVDRAPEVMRQLNDIRICEKRIRYPIHWSRRGFRQPMIVGAGRIEADPTGISRPGSIPLEAIA